MFLTEYIESIYPGRDYTEFSFWDIGEIDLNLIFPNRLVYRPLLFPDSPHLPYKYLHFWKVQTTILWQCNYCNFWCDEIDQRIMELHLIKCQYVSISLFLLLTPNSFLKKITKFIKFFY